MMVKQGNYDDDEDTESQAKSTLARFMPRIGGRPPMQSFFLGTYEIDFPFLLRLIRQEVYLNYPGWIWRPVAWTLPRCLLRNCMLDGAAVRT